jgi:UDP-N-acetylglucosamine 2-epimerase
MSARFFRELSLPSPYVNLEVGSGSHAWQTAEIMVRLEKVLKEVRPDVVLSPGDTNSTLAGIVTAAKSQIPTAHVEAGARSYDMRMPEELNRVMVDHVSTYLFASTRNCVSNLRREKVHGRLYFSGDLMYDVFVQNAKKIKASEVMEQLELEKRRYAVLTMHRAENVDNVLALRNIISALEFIDVEVVFPIHPRTRKSLEAMNLMRHVEDMKHLRLVDPLGYFDSLKLISESSLVLTDSGGVQKEAFWAGIPCVTLRENTEWPETVRARQNFLVGTEAKKISHVARRLLETKHRFKSSSARGRLFGSGRAAKRIVGDLQELLL